MRSRSGFTLVELIIVVGIIGVVAAIAVPGLLRARSSGNEASAIGSLRAINSGQASYSSSCAPGGFAVSLVDLVKPPVGGGAGFISPDLNANPVIKSGYFVRLAPNGGTPVGTPATSCNATQAESAYYANADPATFSGTGTRSFGTDMRGTLYQKAAATFGGAPVAGDTPVQ